MLERRDAWHLLVVVNVLQSNLNTRRKLLAQTREARKSLLTDQCFAQALVEVARRETNLENLVKLEAQLQEAEYRELEHKTRIYNKLHSNVLDTYDQVEKKRKTRVIAMDALAAANG
ncbi:MAG: hypothetical protein LBU23_05120 [Planctomycetota bacterium]|jgi:flagellar biosynthesis component FlhA|nr:hypothetical protein [Planctomycetota bacterium]